MTCLSVPTLLRKIEGQNKQMIDGITFLHFKLLYENNLT